MRMTVFTEEWDDYLSEVVDVDPEGPDDELGAAFDSDFVYCSPHATVHSIGSGCDALNRGKLPLKARSEGEAQDNARALGLLLVGEFRPCGLCGSPVRRISTDDPHLQDSDGQTVCSRPARYHDGHVIADGRSAPLPARRPTS